MLGVKLTLLMAMGVMGGSPLRRLRVATRQLQWNGDSNEKVVPQCKAGYNDVSGGSAFYWSCAFHCEGGPYYATEGCICACLTPEQETAWRGMVTTLPASPFSPADEAARRPGEILVTPPPATTRRPFDPVSEIPVGEIDGESPSGSGSSSSGGSPSSSFSLATPTAAPKAQVIHNKALDMNVVVIAVIAACGIAGVTLIFVICFNCRSMASIFRKNEQVEKPKFAMAPVLRLHADPGASNSPCCDVEEEQRWLRERQERRPVPRRAASHGPFRRVEPGDSPKAIAESQATRVPGTNQVVPTVTPAAETTEEIVPAPEPAEEIEPSVPTPEQIKAFCQSTEALVSSPLEVAVEAEVSSLEAVEAEAPSMPEQIEAAPAISLPPEKEPSVFPEEPPSISVPTEIEAASISMPTADQIKAFCESTQALVESPIVQGPAPEGSELSEAARRLSLELDECF